MKKDKLYTVNKWNANIFWPGGDTDTVDKGVTNYSSGSIDNPYAGMSMNSKPFGSMITNPSAKPINPYGQTSNSYTGDNSPNYGYTINGQSNVGVGASDITSAPSYNKSLIPTFTDWASQAVGTVTFNKDKPATPDAASGVSPAKTFMDKYGGIIGAGVSMFADALPFDRDKYKRGAWDAADPVYHLAGGHESGIGNAVSDVGVGLTKAGLSTGNFALAGIGAGAKVLGGLWNGAFGTKWNNGLIDKINTGSRQMRQAGEAFGQAKTSSDFFNAANLMGNKTTFGYNDLGSTGWFRTNNALKRKARTLNNRQNAAAAYQSGNMQQAANKIDRYMDDIAMKNGYAFGGSLDQIGNVDMDAVGYSMMSDYLNMKNRQNDIKDKMPGMTVQPMYSPFAFGGNLFADGGIEIKHPGRLTELKKRTGKTEAELWAEGKPEVRKMITFARNARKWQKAYGGYLDATKNLFDDGGPIKPQQRIENGIIYDERPREGVSSNNYRHVGDVNSTYAEDAEGNVYDYSTKLPEVTVSVDNRNIQEKMKDAYGGLGRNPKYHSNSVERQIKDGYNFFWPGAMRYAPTTLASVAGVPFVTKFMPETEGLEEFPGLAGAAESLDNMLPWGVAGMFPLADLSHKAGMLPPSKSNRKALGGSIKPTNNIFALGGDIQNHGADWTNGVTHVDAGGSHEENEEGGVQMGVDSQGVPNKVEEGEVIFNDYVYSKRIMLDDDTKKRFHVSKKQKVSYADMAKRLEKESLERPNDPISKAALKVQLGDLADEQERQKEEMAAERAQDAFMSLSPQEQTALMQQLAAQENAARQQQAGGMAEEQPSSEEEMMMQQQMAAYQGVPADAMMQQQMMQGQPVQEGYAPEGYAAYGGHLFAEGGLKKNLMRALGLHTNEAFERWAKENKVDTANWDWDKALDNKAFVDALTKDNPALAHAISTGKYDFGAFTPDKSGRLTFPSITEGNWENQLYEGWKNSKDPSWLEAVENWKKTLGDNWADTVKGYTREQIADALRGTKAFQRGTKWLQDSEDNRLRYLTELYLNEATPEKAKKYAEKYITKDASGNVVWKDGAARDYATIFDNPSGRAANPGTYWHTPVEAVRDKQVKNWVKGPNGWELIEGDVPKEWKAVSNYAWATPESDMQYNYFEAPGNAGGGATVTLPDGQKAAIDKNGNVVTESEWVATPNYKPEWYRYAGLFGPAIGLGLWGAGVGKPDTAQLDAAASMGTGEPYLAGVKYIGNYQKYNPFDIWRQQNRMDANTNAAYRSLANNGAPIGTKMAGVLAGNYGSQMGSGELGVKAQEYNNNLNNQVQTFNRGTDMFDAEAYNKNALANADFLNRQKQYNAQLAMTAAREKMDADAAWYQGLYGNISGLTKGFSGLGNENANRNMIAEMAADGLFGVMSPRTNVGRRGHYINWEKNPLYNGATTEMSASEGGALYRRKNRRKGGLTY